MSHFPNSSDLVPNAFVMFSAIMVSDFRRQQILLKRVKTMFWNFGTPTFKVARATKIHLTACKCIEHHKEYYKQ